tara:strand:- start:3935 stop:4789 length:855 start_codon:yes stop_codon:yes gene_type:complete
MENNLVFEVKNLACAYKSSISNVLEIDDLLIEKGSLVFIIGPSGVGKSTILETLGLMNNTVKSNSSTVLDLILEDGNKIDLLNIWDSKNSYISSLRNEFYSFIFQSNNLFNSLTAFQNVLSSSLIQGQDIKFKAKEAESILNELLSDLNIDSRDDIDITTMSGGQRQRISFARAILADFKILFADEPTGNLDWYNAKKLMNFLKKKIPSHGAGIIVSHDINLSLEFADKIVLIDKKNKKVNGEDFSYGIISLENTFVKENNSWTNGKIKLDNSNFLSFIKEKFI